MPILLVGIGKSSAYRSSSQLLLEDKVQDYGVMANQLGVSMMIIEFKTLRKTWEHYFFAGMWLARNHLDI